MCNAFFVRYTPIAYETENTPAERVLSSVIHNSSSLPCSVPSARSIPYICDTNKATDTMDEKGLATMMAHIMGNQYAIMELLADAHSTDEDARVKLLQATINRGQEYAANLLPIYLKVTGGDQAPDNVADN